MPKAIELFNFGGYGLNTGNENLEAKTAIW